MIAFLLLFPMISFLAQGGDRPFQVLEADQIASALVELDPTGASAALDTQAIADLASAAGDKDLSGGRELSDSQRPVCYLHLYPDRRHRAHRLRLRPYVVIDGTGYRTDYEPCQALNMLGSQLVGAS